ncbi:MAG TPA: DUF3455 domain-containing protein [Candidatus Sulfotelmatobacter sp.]|nr:DUF3455 domain-containing protein [Candidatus Sulfotelmatobacter sp.]
MTGKFNQQAKKNASVRMLFAAALVLACAVGSVTSAAAQTVTAPPTPIDITVPVGNTAFLVGHAQGSQGYVCLPSSNGGTSWTINPARPEATLFTNVFGENVQIITHFASFVTNPNPLTAPNPLPLGGNATWQSSLDSSKVWAVATGHINPSSDVESCPHTGSIQCLLLQSIGNQKGPTGGRLLNKVTFIQRLNTNGGSAPTTACSVGQTQLQPYTADYYFYRADN